jgi:hypothetical protein
MEDRTFFNSVALVAAAIVLVSFGVGYLGSALAPRATPSGPGTGTAAPGSGAPTVIYLTINANPITGTPQYTPANFTVPRGTVQFVITNYDVGDNWSGCTCRVSGTVGNVEQINGVTYSEVPSSDVSHTFTIPSLGENVAVPGESTVTFAIQFTSGGYFTWLCNAPCGAGDNPATTDPMGEAGFMAGTITVA